MFVLVLSTLSDFRCQAVESSDTAHDFLSGLGMNEALFEAIGSQIEAGLIGVDQRGEADHEFDVQHWFLITISIDSSYSEDHQYGKKN